MRVEEHRDSWEACFLLTELKGGPYLSRYESGKGERMKAVEWDFGLFHVFLRFEKRKQKREKGKGSRITRSKWWWKLIVDYRR